MKLELEQSLLVLDKAQILLYPTDTVWGLGCDATNEEAVAKIYQIKQREESKSLIVLVDSLDMLKDYVDVISSKTLEIITNAKKPTTIIYRNPKGLAKNTITKDNTVAIRIVQNKFCQKLISEFGKPIVSTSANISGASTPMSFKEIETSILDAVDYVVNLHQERTSVQSSRIIRILQDETIEVIRE